MSTDPDERHPPLAARVCATVALGAAVTTFVAAQVDFVRRHHPGIDPGRYWLPQFTHIWLPGIVVTIVFAWGAMLLERRNRRN